MGFFRNHQVKRDLWVFAFVSLIASVCGFVHSISAGVLILVVSSVLTGIHFLSTYKRYIDIANISKDIDSVLHNNRDILFESYSEGELSVLRNELQKMTIRLKETAEALGKEKIFLQNSIADISHQLRTPLTSLNLVLSVLTSEELDTQHREELYRELHVLISRIDWLVETLLKISKIDAGTVQFRAEYIPASQLIARAIAPLEIAFDIRQQTISVDVENVVFEVDQGWTSEAIGNILKNCMEHTPNGGTITIRASETPFFKELRISDSGNGIPEQDLPHLFERFYKGSNASDGSVGIGLSLCYSIIVAQYGIVTAENTTSGASFIIRFPKKNAEHDKIVI